MLPACAVAQAPPIRALRADDFRNAGLRGVGIGSLRFGDRNAVDHDAVRALGASHVRVFVEALREGASNDFVVSPDQLAALDSMAANLQARGVYMVLAAGFGQDARGEMFRNAKLQASAIRVWRDLTMRLKGRNVVAGFDIVNEPVPDGLTYALRQARWLDFAALMVDAVRSVDPGRVVIIESAPDATGESFESLRPLPFPNLVYSLHSYAPFEFTHQTVMPDFPQLRTYPETGPGGRSSALVLADSLAPVLRFARRHDAPIYVGEFSAPRWAPSESAARYVAESIALFNRHGWSWSYHEFRAWHGWDPEMGPTGREPQPRSDQAPVVRALRSGLRAART